MYRTFSVEATQGFLYPGLSSQLRYLIFRTLISIFLMATALVWGRHTQQLQPLLYCSCVFYCVQKCIIACVCQFVYNCTAVVVVHCQQVVPLLSGQRLEDVCEDLSSAAAVQSTV